MIEQISTFTKISRCGACGELFLHPIRFFKECRDDVCNEKDPHFHRVCVVCSYFWIERLPIGYTPGVVYH